MNGPSASSGAVYRTANNVLTAMATRRRNRRGEAPSPHAQLAELLHLRRENARLKACLESETERATAAEASYRLTLGILRRAERELERLRARAATG